MREWYREKRKREWEEMLCRGRERKKERKKGRKRKEKEEEGRGLFGRSWSAGSLVGGALDPRKRRRVQ